MKDEILRCATEKYASLQTKIALHIFLAIKKNGMILPSFVVYRMSKKTDSLRRP